MLSWRSAQLRMLLHYFVIAANRECGGSKRYEIGLLYLRSARNGSLSVVELCQLYVLMRFDKDVTEDKRYDQIGLLSKFACRLSFQRLRFRGNVLIYRYSTAWSWLCVGISRQPDVIFKLAQRRVLGIRKRALLIDILPTSVHSNCVNTAPVSNITRLCFSDKAASILIYGLHNV